MLSVPSISFDPVFGLSVSFVLSEPVDIRQAELVIAVCEIDVIDHPLAIASVVILCGTSDLTDQRIGACFYTYRSLDDLFGSSKQSREIQKSPTIKVLCDELDRHVCLEGSICSSGAPSIVTIRVGSSFYEL